MKKDEFIDIVREHQKLIYKICASYCSDPASRDDLQQEILMQLWQSFDRFDGRVKMSTWLYRIALNTAISFYRSEQRPSRNAIPLDASVIAAAAPEEQLELDEQISMLYTFINQLNPLDRALILLYLEGNKHRDIAEILGISETNVATKISRIKGTLRSQFTAKTL